MMNIQELQILKIKFKYHYFLINNEGYLSIKQTQKTFLKGNMDHHQNLDLLKFHKSQVF